MDEHKRACMNVSLQLLQYHAAEGDDFILNIMTYDESWFQYFDPKKMTEHGVAAYCISYPQLEKLWNQFSGMSRGAYWLISRIERKLSVQFAMFRCSRNCGVHFVTSTQ
jgi:hypothetical protein